MAKHDLVTQLFYDGQWNDAPAYSQREDASFVRGRADEQGSVTPSSSSSVLDNRSLAYNPKNPLSPLYGLAGRNTPVRRFLGTPHVGDDNSSTVATTAHVAPSLTTPMGGLLICVWAAPEPGSSYTVPGGMSPDTQGGTATTVIRGARQIVAVGATGTRTATLSTSGKYVAASVFINGPAVFPTGTIAPGGTSFTIDGNPGDWWVVASAFASSPDSPTVPLFPSDTDGGGWLLLADTGDVNTADPQAQWMRLKVWVKRVSRQSLAHTITLPGANADTVSWLTRVPSADVLGGWNVRHTGEASSWKPDRTVDFNGSQGDAWTGLVASGVLRRLSQGTEPQLSPFRRTITSAETSADLLAYWPCEEGSGVTSVVSGLPAGFPMAIEGTVTADKPFNYGRGGGPLGASVEPGAASLLDLSAGARLIGSVSTDNASQTQWAVSFAAQANAIQGGLNVNGDIVLAEWTTPTGTYRSFKVLQRDDDLGTEVYGIDPSGTGFLLASTGGSEYVFCEYRVDVNQTSPGNTTIRLWVNGTLRATNAWGIDIGPVTSFRANPERKQLTGSSGLWFGHAQVWRTKDPPSLGRNFIDDATQVYPWFGWLNERGSDRLSRLCREAGISFSLTGEYADVRRMGAQPTDTLTNLFGEVERTDAGMLYEPRAQLGLTYRTRVSLFNQDSALALDWTHLTTPFVPLIDDQKTRNDVIAKREKGSSARAARETGPLNIRRPEEDPEGIGQVKTEVEVNPAGDADLPDLAHWYLNLGTVDDPRFSSVIVDLDATPSLNVMVSAVDIGDLITVDGLPLDLFPDQLRLIVVGYTETIGSHRRLIAFNCLPATAWQVAVYDEPGSRYESLGTQLSSTVGSVATALPVFVIAGPVWTTKPSALPFDISVAGERMTLSGVADLLSDTFTRSVANGWGTADSGQAWSVSGAAASQFSVNGFAGVHTVNANHPTVFQSLLAISLRDFSLRLPAILWPISPAGDIVRTEVLVRWVDANNFVRLNVAITPSSTVDLGIESIVGGVFSTLAALSTGITHTPGVSLRLKTELLGSAIRATVWKDGTPEPDGWQLTAVDPNSQEGQLGILSLAGPSNTNVKPFNVLYDDLSAPNGQILAVTRSVNGIVKTHSAGTRLRLARQLRYA